MKLVDVILLFSLGALAGICFAAWRSDLYHEKQAIKAGVAYYTNNAAGESIFVWRECK